MNEVFLQTFWDLNKTGITHHDCIIFCRIPIAYFLTYFIGSFKSDLQAFVSMPLVFTPFGIRFLFTSGVQPKLLVWSLSQTIILISAWHFLFLGILIGSIIFNLPFMVNSIQTGFKQFTRIPQRCLVYIRKIKGNNHIQGIIAKH